LVAQRTGAALRATTKTDGKANRLSAIGTIDSTDGFEASPRPP